MKENELKEITLTSDYDGIEEADIFIRAAISHLCDELVTNIPLAVNEAVTNAVIHGNERNSSKSVHLTVKMRANTVVIRVQDEGKGFDAAAVPDPTEEDRLLNQGGRGIYLMRQYADEVSFEKQGTRVKMRFYR